MVRNAPIGGIFVSFFARNQKFIKSTQQNLDAIKRQRKEMRALRDSSRKLRRNFQRLASSFASFAGIAGVGAATAGLTAAVKEAGNFAVELDKMAVTAGVSVERMQEWINVAGQLGIQADDIVDILKELRVRIDEAVSLEGTTPIEGFMLLGIDPKQVVRDGLTTEQTLDKVRASVRSLQSQGVQGSAQAALAVNELLGDVGTRSLAFFGIANQELQDLFNRFGNISNLTTDQVESLINLNQKFTGSTTGVKNAIRGLIADNEDVFNRLIDLFENLIPDAFEKSIDAIEFLQNNAILLRGSLSLLIATIIRGTGIVSFTVAVGVLTKSMIVGTVAANTYAAALQLVKRTLVSTGIGIVIVLIGELVAWIYTLIKETDSIGGAFKRAWDIVRVYTKATFDLQVGRAGVAINEIIQGFEKYAVVVGDLLDAVVTVHIDSWSTIQNYVEGAYQFLKAELLGFVISGLTTMRDWADGNLGYFEDVVAYFLVAKSHIQVAWESMLSIMDSITPDYVNRITGYFNTQFDGVIAKYNEIANFINQFNPLGKVFDIIPTIDIAEVKKETDKIGNAVILSIDDAKKQIQDEGGVGSALVNPLIGSLETAETTARTLANGAVALANSFDPVGQVVNDTTAAIERFNKRGKEIDAESIESRLILNLEYQDTIATLDQLGQQAEDTGKTVTESFEDAAANVGVLTGSIVGDTKEAMEDTLSDLEIVKNRFDEGLKSAYGSVVDNITDLTVVAIKDFNDLGDAARAVARIIRDTLLREIAKAIIGRALIGFGLPLPQGFQHGGLANPGFAIVGEAGPELVDFRRPGRVYTNEQLENAVNSRGGTTVYFQPNIYSSDGAAVTKAIQDAFPVIEQEIEHSIINKLSTPTTSRLLVRG